MSLGPQGKRILIVDDEVDITSALKKGMETKGFLVDAHNAPTEAIRRFKPNTYSLAILDVRMPEMSGFELYRELKKLDGNLNFFFFTAIDIYPSEFERIFPDVNVKAFIKKPISLSQLVIQLNLVADRPAKA
ncbi:MAG: response regulator [Thaumarchaeota archaeon]|nr:response regulator [Nitrososphaerota archaeon]